MTISIKETQTKMKKSTKTDVYVNEIKEQYKKLETVANEFSSKVNQIKEDQDKFVKYMKLRNLIH